MNVFSRRIYYAASVLSLSLLNATVVSAMEFEPGVGAGVEYTDNATLSDSNKVNDIITAAYIGARLSDTKGPFNYNATTSFNNHNYTQNTYSDQRYFNLAADANWEMIKKRFNWILSDNFNQRPVVSSNSNTPDNVQNTNVFNLGANIRWRPSARQNLSLMPMFKQFYYETLLSDNKQYSLTANWNYQMFRLTSIGLNLSGRRIEYFQTAIASTSFANIALVTNTRRKRSNLTLNLGGTNVQRDGGGETSGFSGNLNWLLDLSTRSAFNATASTELTDTSTVAASADPSVGNEVQVSTDVVRNTAASLTYIRDDATVDSRIWIRYNELKYSDNPLDREIRSVGAKATRPIGRLLKGSLYATYGRTKQLQSDRLDKRITVGGNLRYRFTRKWHSLFDMKYRTKDSTDVSQNFNEFSVFATLVYGFGDVYRPSRSGGS